jgi:hypothetical protein
VAALSGELRDGGADARCRAGDEGDGLRAQASSISAVNGPVFDRLRSAPASVKRHPECSQNGSGILRFDG